MAKSYKQILLTALVAFMPVFAACERVDEITA
jgi:hypothetical protein